MASSKFKPLREIGKWSFLFVDWIIEEIPAHVNYRNVRLIGLLRLGLCGAMLGFCGWFVCIVWFSLAKVAIALLLTESGQITLLAILVTFGFVTPILGFLEYRQAKDKYQLQPEMNEIFMAYTDIELKEQYSGWVHREVHKLKLLNFFLGYRLTFVHFDGNGNLTITSCFNRRGSLVSMTEKECVVSYNSRDDLVHLCASVSMSDLEATVCLAALHREAPIEGLRDCRRVSDTEITFGTTTKGFNILSDKDLLV